MPNFSNMLKGMDIQTIGGIIAAVLAIVGLIAGVSAATNTDGNASSSSTASEPQYVTDFYNANVASLKAEGYTITDSANQRAQELAETEFTGNFVKLDIDGFRGDFLNDGEAGLTRTTNILNELVVKVEALDIPAGSKGEAGIGYVVDGNSARFVILRQNQ